MGAGSRCLPLDRANWCRGPAIGRLDVLLVDAGPDRMEVGEREGGRSGVGFAGAGAVRLASRGRVRAVVAWEEARLSTYEPWRQPAVATVRGGWPCVSST